jgi:hypothetical protein
MIDKRQEKEMRDAILASVVKEMALNAYVHYRDAKFHVGQSLYNRKTKEDGLIRHVFASDGIITYEVWVPKESNSWKAGHWISRWFERGLMLSGNYCLSSPT